MATQIQVRGGKKFVGVGLICIAIGWAFSITTFWVTGIILTACGAIISITSDVEIKWRCEKRKIKDFDSHLIW